MRRLRWPQPTIILSRRDEPEPGKSRLTSAQTGEEQWHVLADPEGNEFCLLKARLNRL